MTRPSPRKVGKALSRTVHVTVECVLYGDSTAMLDAMEKAVAEKHYRPHIHIGGAGEQYGVFGSYGIESGDVVRVEPVSLPRKVKALPPIYAIIGSLIDAWEQMPNDLRDERLDRRMADLVRYVEEFGVPSLPRKAGARRAR